MPAARQSRKKAIVATAITNVASHPSTSIERGSVILLIVQSSTLTEAGLDFALGPDAMFGITYAGQLAGDLQDNGCKGPRLALLLLEKRRLPLAQFADLELITTPELRPLTVR